MNRLLSCLHINFFVFTSLFFLVLLISPAAMAMSVCEATPTDEGDAVEAGMPGPLLYFQPTASVSAGAITIPLLSTAGLSAGDMVLVIQMQGAGVNSDNNNSYGDGAAGDPASGWLNDANFTAGRYEYASVDSVGGGNLNLVSPLINSYVRQNATGSIGRSRYQVVRVPQYSNVTLAGDITGPAWNGETGGVLPIDVANTFDFNGYSIDMNAKGFRGGGGFIHTGIGGYSNNDFRNNSSTTTTGAHGSKGEGIAGTPRLVFNGIARIDTGIEGYPNGSYGMGAPGNAGGGGTDGRPSNNDENSGGGGGANGGSGARGGNSWNSNLPVGGFGGAFFAQAAANRIVMGGGGGAATGNNGTTTPPHGGVGGGIVLVRAYEIVGTGSIDVNGGDGTTPNPTNDGGGGGGAGGSVILLAETQTGSITINAVGGNGGNAHPGGVSHGPGGGGGGGVAFNNPEISPVFNISQGASGYTVNPGNYFGATPTGGDVGNGDASTDPDDVDGNSGGADCVTRVDLILDKSRSGALLQPANTSQFQFVVSNAGPDDTDEDIVVTDVLDTDFSYLGFTGTDWNCVEAPVQTVTCSHPGPLLVGESLPDLFIDVIVAASASGAISNSATVSGGSDNTDADPSNNTSILNDFVYAPATGNKALYLNPDSVTTGNLQRTVPGVDDIYRINRGNGPGRYMELDLNPVLATDFTLENDIVLHLCSRRYNNNTNRTINVSLRRADTDALIGSVSPNQTFNGAAWTWRTFTMPHTGPTTIPTGVALRLRITNVGPNAGNRDVGVTANGAGGLCSNTVFPGASSVSQLAIDATTVVNIENIEVYNAASPSGTLINNTVESATVYVRATVSDPFGFADINNNTFVEVLDNSSSVVVGPLGDTAILSQSGAEKVFEYQVAMPADRSAGPFTIRVTANEGNEGTVSHSNALVFSLTDPPLLVVTKLSSVTNASPLEEVDYQVTVSNTSVVGTGDAINVIVRDELSRFMAFKLGSISLSDGPAPYSASGLNILDIEYSDDDGATWTYTPVSQGGGAPVGFDSNVNQFRVVLDGIMAPGSGFRIDYTLQVK